MSARKAPEAFRMHLSINMSYFWLSHRSLGQFELESHSNWMFVGKTNSHRLLIPQQQQVVSLKNMAIYRWSTNQAFGWNEISLLLTLHQMYSGFSPLPSWESWWMLSPIFECTFSTAEPELRASYSVERWWEVNAVKAKAVNTVLVDLPSHGWSHEVI